MSGVPAGVGALAIPYVYHSNTVVRKTDQKAAFVCKECLDQFDDLLPVPCTSCGMTCHLDCVVLLVAKRQWFCPECYKNSEL